MFTKKIFTFFTMFLLILSGGIAYAHGKNRDAAAFFFQKKAAVDMTQIIERVEKEENGRVVFFKIEEEEDNPIQYEMKILKDGKLLETKVDPESGKVLKTESEGHFFHFFGDREKAPSNTKFSLKDAVSIVEKRYEGKAPKGAFQEKWGVKMFRLKVANNEGAFTVMVDANTGEVFRVTSGNGREHDDEEHND